jgi:hypothetical protein
VAEGSGLEISLFDSFSLTKLTFQDLTPCPLTLILPLPAISDKGNSWVERILSLRQTCRLQTKRTFPVLVEALDCYFKGSKPNLAWIAQS